MQPTMDATLIYQPARISNTRIWTGRVLCCLVVLFLAFDCVGKFVKPAPVVEAFAHLGFPLSLSVAIGTILLVCTTLYAIPRTAILGAVLLTGYLGGAVVTQLRVGEPLFNVLFPVFFRSSDLGRAALARTQAERFYWSSELRRIST